LLAAIADIAESAGRFKPRLMNIFSIGSHLFLIIIVLIFWKLQFRPSNSLTLNHKIALVWLAFMFLCAVSLYFALEKWSSPSLRDDA
jgi:hypothetical protein